MSTRDTIVRNTFWYGVVTAAGLVAGLLTSVVLARGLGPARMGEYSYLIWLLRAITVVATLGFPFAVTRYTASALGQGRPALASAFLRLLLRRQLVVAAAAVVLLAPLVLQAAPLEFRGPMLAMLVGLFPTTAEAVYAHAAYGAQRYDLTAQVSTVKMTLQLLSAAVVVTLGGDFLALVVGGLVGTSISCLLQRRRALALYPAAAGAVPDDARRELRAYLIPLSIVAVLDTLVWDRSEIVFLRLYTSSEQIAFYSLAFGLASRAMTAPSVLIGALLPALATLDGRGDRAAFGRVYRESLRAVAIVGAPLVVVGTALAPGLIRLLYGAPYLPVALLLGPMLLVSLVGVMRQVAWSALRAVGDRRWALHATWLGAAVDVGTAVALVPAWGVWGAVVANAAAQLLAAAVAFVAVARRQRCGFPALDLLRIAAAAGAGLAATWIAARRGDTFLDLLAAGTAGLLAFAAAAGVLGALGPGEWALVERPLRALPRWARRTALAGGVGLALAALYAPVAGRLARVWLGVPYYSYGILVPVFSAYLVWDARHRLAAAAPAWRRPWLALAGAGLLLLAVGDATGSLTLATLSLPVIAAGLGLFVLGPDGFRGLAFPVGFLAFMAPLPEGAIPALSLPLQRLAAWTAATALPPLGVPAVRDGLFIHLPAVTLHVSEACNGLRFLLAMIVVGTAFAWTAGGRLGRRLAVVGLAVLVAVVANLIRVTGTGLLAHYWGPRAAAGFFHVAYGKVVYLALLVPFVVGVARLRRPVRLRRADHGA